MHKTVKKSLAILLAIILLIFTLFIAFNWRGAINIAKEKISLMQECVPVLAFHGFAPAETKNQLFADNKWIDDIEGFEQQMQYLYDNGWTTLTADEFYAWHSGEIEIPKKSCLLTFDDGYYEMYYTILPILQKYDFNATCFIVGSYTPDLTASYNPKIRNMIGWDKIQDIKSIDANIQFESHSYNLHGYDSDGNEPWSSATREQLENDFNMNSVYDFKYMAYPYGGYNDLMLDAIKQSNIKMAFTFKQSGYATKHSPIYEIPRQKVTSETSYEDFIRILEKTL